MRYVITIVWTFILVQMLSYVVSSMIGVSYDFATASILGIGAAVLILLVTVVLPNEPVEKAQH